REEVDTDSAGVLIGLLDGELAPDLALRAARPLAGEEQQISAPHRVDVIRDRRRRRAQLELELLDPLLGAHLAGWIGVLRVWRGRRVGLDRPLVGGGRVAA